MFALIARLPQPSKGLYLAFFVVFAGTFVTHFVGGERSTTLASGLLGVVAVLVGVTVGTNLNGGANALTDATKSYRPLGVDYSRSVFASPRSPGCSGLMMLIVGVVFVAGAVAEL